MFDPKISILMMSYNQGEFISEAIESVLKQKHTYNWELIIADDFSTDNTSEIVEHYVKMYPDKIFYYKNNINVGLHKNYVKSIKLLSGKYIALLEADDYWIDENKLKLQIELLESNSEISWCFTNGITISKTGNIINEFRYNFQNCINVQDFFQNPFNPLNNTIVFRKECEPEIYPDFFYLVAQWDTVLHYLRSLNSNLIGFIPINGLAWRRHDNATSFTTNFSGSKRYKDWILINDSMKKIVPKNYKLFFNRNFVAYEALAIYYFKIKKYYLFVYYFFLFLIKGKAININKLRNFYWKLRHDY